MSLYYSRLRVLRAFKFFFLFLHFVQISNMDDNTNYQEDYEEDLLSDIFPLREQTSGQKKSHVLDYYETHSIKTWTCRLYLLSLRVEADGGKSVRDGRPSSNLM